MGSVARVLLSVALAVASLLGGARAAEAIIGGAPTTIAEHPWQVILQVNNSALCSGALVSSTWLVTAAHCVDGVGPDRVRMWAGLTSLSERGEGNRLPVAEVIVHPGWNRSSYANDIALVRLAAPWTGAANLQAISLPTTVDAANWPVQGSLGTISGWGVLSFGGQSTDQLQRADVHVLASPGAPCGSYGPQFDPAVQLCAGELNGTVDTCQGDSGGPLVVVENGTPLLAGITSIGNDCATPNYPGVYSRVTTFIPWIRQYADIPIAAPQPPTGVLAQAIAGGRVNVSWTPSTATGGADITSYTVLGAPDGATCSALATACTVQGLVPGRPYAFTVTASNPAGTSAASVPSAPVIAVSGTSRKGATVKRATVLKWAGVSGSQPSLKVLTKRHCVAAPAGVRMTRAGLCKVRVSAGGATGVAHIAVR